MTTTGLPGMLARSLQLSNPEIDVGGKAAVEQDLPLAVLARGGAIPEVDEGKPPAAS